MYLERDIRKLFSNPEYDASNLACLLLSLWERIKILEDEVELLREKDSDD